MSSSLLSRSEQPSAVLDGNGTVRARNLALERLLESPTDGSRISLRRLPAVERLQRRRPGGIAAGRFAVVATFEVASAAERAGLSQRQREALGHLLLGRTAEQIGALRQITHERRSSIKPGFSNVSARSLASTWSGSLCEVFL